MHRGSTRASRLTGSTEYAVQVAREIDAHGDVAALAGEAGPAAARDDRRVVRAADADRFDHFRAGARGDDGDRHLPVIGRVGRVERFRLRAEIRGGTEGALEIRLERTRRIRRIAVPFTQHLAVGCTRREPRLARH